MGGQPQVAGSSASSIRSTTTRSSNSTTYDSDDMSITTTTTATRTRRQLQGDAQNDGVVRSRNRLSAGHMMNGSHTKSGSNTLGGIGGRSANGSGGGGSGGGENSWSSSWSAFTNMASSVLSGDSLDSNDTTGKVSGKDEDERKRRLRIAEKRRRAGLDGVVGGGSGKSSSSAASHVAPNMAGSSSMRSRTVGSSIMGDGEGDIRTRGRRKAGPEPDENSKIYRPASISSVSSYNTNYYKRSKSPPETEGYPLTNQPPIRASSSPPTADCSDGDTLAYVHKVKPTDTLEGVVIMFNIHPSALRRANRLWLGDSIQVRKELLLPVDECLVKGRPLTIEEEKEEKEKQEKRRKEEEERKEKERRKKDELISLSSIVDSGVDNLDGSGSSRNTGRRKIDPMEAAEMRDSVTNLPDNNATNKTLDGGGGGVGGGESAGSRGTSEPPYKHHSYVIISGIGTVEIARLSRNKLSHFPSRTNRARRGVSVSSTIEPPWPANPITDPDSTNPTTTGSPSLLLDDPPSTIFSTRKISTAYSGLPPTALNFQGGGEIPTLGQMFSQVARETMDGMENVGSLVEGFVRKMVVKVGEMARDGGEAAIELAERVGEGRGGSSGGRGVREREGGRGGGGGGGSGSRSVSSAGSSRVTSKAGTMRSRGGVGSSTSSVRSRE